VIGSIQKWGDKGYVIYVSKRYQKILEELHGKKVVVIVIPLEE